MAAKLKVTNDEIVELISAGWNEVGSLIFEFNLVCEEFYGIRPINKAAAARFVVEELAYRQANHRPWLIAFLKFLSSRFDLQQKRFLLNDLMNRLDLPNQNFYAKDFFDSLENSENIEAGDWDDLQHGQPPPYPQEPCKNIGPEIADLSGVYYVISQWLRNHITFHLIETFTISKCGKGSLFCFRDGEYSGSLIRDKRYLYIPLQAGSENQHNSNVYFNMFYDGVSAQTCFPSSMTRALYYGEKTFSNCFIFKVGTSENETDDLGDYLSGIEHNGSRKLTEFSTRIDKKDMVHEALMNLPFDEDHGRVDTYDLEEQLSKIINQVFHVHQEPDLC